MKQTKQKKDTNYLWLIVVLVFALFFFYKNESKIFVIFITVISFTAILIVIQRYLIQPWLEKKELELFEKNLIELIGRMSGYISKNNYQEFKYKLDKMKRDTEIENNPNLNDLYQRVCLDMFIAIAKEKSKEPAMPEIWLDYAKEIRTDARKFIEKASIRPNIQSSIVIEFKLAFIVAESVLNQTGK